MRRCVAGYVVPDVSKESIALASHLQSTGILSILAYLMYLKLIITNLDGE